MKVTDITGVTEKLGIIVSKGCQLLAIVTDAADFVLEEIEIEIVDIFTGKSISTHRAEKVILMAEPCAQSGNLRPQGTALIEVSDGRDLDLNANRYLRVNLTKLSADKTYTVYAIESGILNGTPAVWEQLFIANGVKLQKFPVNDGSFIVLPKTDLNDIRIVYNDGTECRMDAAELTIKAIATNGVIEVDDANQPTKVGSSKCFIVDLSLTSTTGQTKRVTEIEVRLLLGNGYTMYKVSNLDHAGFDWRF